VADAARRTAGGAELLREVGLLADGPVRWGAPVRSSRPGVYLVELPAPLPHAVIDLSPVGAWIDRVPTLELDGARPTGRELAARLHRFWLPDQVVLFVGSTDGAIGRRVDELLRTPLGDALPCPEGRWLKTLRGLDAARIWWAETPAPEEYEDAVLAAFAAAVDPAAAASLMDPTVIVPFANMDTPSGPTKAHGITGDLRAAPAVSVAPRPRDAVTLPPGDAVSSDRAMAPRGRATGGASRRTRPAAAAAGAAGPGGPIPRAPASRTRAPKPLSAAANRRPEPTLVSLEGLRQLKDELEDLVRVRRPEIIARVRAARELGDLSENADYEAARKEQSFAEGRIAQLEAMIKHAQVIEAPADGDEVGLGSTVVVESPEGEESYTIVGSSEARPAEGRISNTSPLGAALLGRRLGDDVVVRAPVGDRHYRILEVRHR
jgi:transcription elongation factor GreA